MADTNTVSGRNMVIAMGIDIVAAVCGALLAGAFGAASPGDRLIGSVIAAVVATLFTVVGPYLHLRVAGAVTVTVLALVITYSGAKAVEIDGPASDSFRHDLGCTGTQLRRHESCAIAIAFSGRTTGVAHVLVHQNLKGPASRIDLIGSTTPGNGAPPAALPDLTLSSAPECSVVRSGSLHGGDSLTIFVSVRNNGPAHVRRLVPYTLLSDTGLHGGGNSSLSDGPSVTAMRVDLRPSDYHRTHRFTIAADPQNVIAEENESNNILSVRVSLRSRPDTVADQPCRLL